MVSHHCYAEVRPFRQLDSQHAQPGASQVLILGHFAAELLEPCGYLIRCPAEQVLPCAHHVVSSFTSLTRRACSIIRMRGGMASGYSAVTIVPAGAANF